MTRLFLAVSGLMVAVSAGAAVTPLPATAPPAAGVPLFSTKATEPVALPAAFVGRVLLSADVNGRLVWLHLDTGNYTLLLGTDDARKAGLVADPTTHNSQRVHVSIGDVEAPAVFFRVSRYGFNDDDHWVAGNIGTPFLRANVVTIDYPRRQVIFYPRGTFTPPANVAAIPILMYNNIPTIGVSFGSVRGRFGLDTGAEVTEISPGFARRLALGLNVGADVTYACGHQENDPVYIAPDFTIGRVTVKQLRVDAANPCGISEDGILGRDVLSHFSLTLDYINRVVYLANPSP